jgi:hypothetical protein
MQKKNQIHRLQFSASASGHDPEQEDEREIAKSFSHDYFRRRRGWRQHLLQSTCPMTRSL